MRKNPAAKAAKLPAPRARQAPPVETSAPDAFDAAPLTPEETVEYLWSRWRIQRSIRRLAQLRMLGSGPAFVRDGNVVRYPPRLVDQWAVQVLGPPVRSTAEEAAHHQNNFANKNAARAVGIARASDEP
jgi:hypothetical protein